jgi:hypothetical protein
MFIACQEGEKPTDRSSYHGSNNSDSESIKQQNPKQKIVKPNEIGIILVIFMCAECLHLVMVYIV